MLTSYTFRLVCLHTLKRDNDGSESVAHTEMNVWREQEFELLKQINIATVGVWYKWKDVRGNKWLWGYEVWCGKWRGRMDFHVGLRIKCSWLISCCRIRLTAKKYWVITWNAVLRNLFTVASFTTHEVEQSRG